MNNELTEIVNRIIGAVPIERLYLFGSYPKFGLLSIPNPLKCSKQGDNGHNSPKIFGTTPATRTQPIF